MAKVIAKASEFDSTLSSAGDKLVVVDFTASWCGPCKMIGPVFDSLAREHAGNAHFIKVDVDQHSGIAQRYGVRAMPTFLFLRRGGILEQLRGANAGKLTQLTQQYIKGGNPIGGASGAFAGKGNSLSGNRTTGAQASAGGLGGLFGQIPRENLVPFAIIIAYLVYIVYSRS